MFNNKSFREINEQKIYFYNYILIIYLSILNLFINILNYNLKKTLLRYFYWMIKKYFNTDIKI